MIAVMASSERLIAYFSMEIAIRSDVPTYSGGLGVLAGDVVRTAADLGVPMVAVTLLHRKGYFTQRIGPDGWQKEEPVEWKVEDVLEPMPQRASVELEGKTVYLRAWKYDVVGKSGFVVPIYFLDTDLEENPPEARTLTHTLYGGDTRYRLCQEAIFGIGGVRMLRVLGYEGIVRYHMNEGHAALLTLALLDGEARKAGRTHIALEDLERVRRRCIFTTHTPLSAGHDRFPRALIEQVLGPLELDALHHVIYQNDTLDMTQLALNLSQYINAVTRRHGEVSSQMFGRPVQVVTNGVHVETWTSPPFKALYDCFIPSWRSDPFSLRHALTIPKEKIWQAHLQAKRRLLDRIKSVTGQDWDERRMTIGFARRATGYKRAQLLFKDIQRLRQIAQKAGGFQLVYAGKAHPHDEEGKAIIREVIEAGKQLGPEIPFVYLEDYDMELGALLVAGSDVWLNTPQPPLEASGTSGMKAALNGVPSLSVLDGWWIEGHQEGITGWAIGEPPSSDPSQDRMVADSNSLYEKLEGVVLPLFYTNQDGFVQVMRQAIALNGSFFHTHRMLGEYVLQAYFA